MTDRRTLAHVVPFLVFMLLVGMPGFFGFFVENSELPWWRAYPAHWRFPLQTILCLGLLWWFWKEYPVKPVRGLILGIVLGALGIACWILPSKLYLWLDVPSWPQPNMIAIPFITSSDTPVWEYLGMAERTEGFDPTLAFYDGQPFWKGSSIFMRFVRMVIVVPLGRGDLLAELADAILHQGGPLAKSEIRNPFVAGIFCFHHRLHHCSRSRGLVCLPHLRQPDLLGHRQNQIALGSGCHARHRQPPPRDLHAPDPAVGVLVA